MKLSFIFQDGELPLSRYYCLTKVSSKLRGDLHQDKRVKFFSTLKLETEIVICNHTY